MIEAKFSFNVLEVEDKHFLFRYGRGNIVPCKNLDEVSNLSKEKFTEFQKVRAHIFRDKDDVLPRIVEADKMPFARELAAQAWCKEKTKDKTMDTDLAEAFAEILVIEMYDPHLGCATTEELLDEIKARVDLNYKTISSD